MNEKIPALKKRLPITALFVTATLALGFVLSFFCDHSVINYVSLLQTHFRLNATLLAILAKWITFIIPMLGVAFVLKYPTQKYEIVTDILIPVIAAFLLSQVIHLTVHRERPFATLHTTPLVPHNSDSSFPSDHAVLGFAFSVTLFAKSKKLGSAALITACIVGGARVFTLLHWPSDIIGGAFFGTLSGLVVPWARSKFEKWITSQGWQVLFENDNKFRSFIVALRTTAVFGVLLRFLLQHENLFLNSKGETRYNPTFNLGFAVPIICAIFALYVLKTNEILFARPADTEIKTAFMSASRLLLLRTINPIWMTLVCDYGFYSLFYVLSGKFDSNLFSLFFLPLITASLFRDFIATARAFIISILALTCSILVLSQLGADSSGFPPNLSPKQWLSLGVFAPRLFMLSLCCLPIAWLVEQHSQLERARAFYESLFEHIPLNITRKNLEGVITYANKSFCELNSLSRGEIIGRTDERLYGSVLANKFRIDDDEVIRSGCILPIDERHRAHGQDKDMDVEGRKIPVKVDGKVVEIQIVFWDVTQKRQAEAQFSALMETTHDFIYFKDTESNFLRISKVQANHFQLTDPSQAIGKSDKDFFGETHAKETRKDEVQIMSTRGVTADKEENFKWPDGSEPCVSTTKQCLMDKSGNLIGTFGISRDISHRKNNQLTLALHQTELIKAKSLLDLVLDCAAKIAHFGFWESNIFDENQMKATDELYRIFGLTLQSNDVKLRHLRDLIHPDDLNVWDENFARGNFGQAFPQFDLRLCLQDGTKKHLRAKSEPIPNDEKNPGRLIGVVLDVTDHKRHEMRAAALHLVLRGFYHMIPGAADKSLWGLKSENRNNAFESDVTKALCFIFMVWHKADEVKSILKETPLFRSYTLTEIWNMAWPVALDLQVSVCDGLERVYTGGITESTIVNGAFYSAAVNILSNARSYGTAPFIVWTQLKDSRIDAVFADGGPNGVFSSRGDRERGVGLPLVRKILELVKGELEQLNKDRFSALYPDAPQQLLSCQTFYRVLLPYNHQIERNK